MLPMLPNLRRARGPFYIVYDQLTMTRRWEVPVECRIFLILFGVLYPWIAAISTLVFPSGPGRIWSPLEYRMLRSILHFLLKINCCDLHPGVLISNTHLGSLCVFSCGVSFFRWFNGTWIRPSTAPKVLFGLDKPTVQTDSTLKTL